MSDRKELSIAVCLFPNVTALDYQGAIELLGFLKTETLEKKSLSPSPKVSLRFTFLSHTLDPVPLSSGPDALPQGTYREVINNNQQFDIFLVPGGPGARPDAVPDDVLEFVKHQTPGAKYILSVCTGSWILAGAGILEGKKATTNKSTFKECKDATSKNINWVAKARWTIDGNIWTSSGVTAGMDMANAFLVHLVGDEVARVIRGIVELSAKGEGDDEFAEFYGLV